MSNKIDQFAAEIVRRLDALKLECSLNAVTVIKGLAEQHGITEKKCVRCGTEPSMKSSPWCGRCWHIETAPKDIHEEEKTSP